MVAIKLLLCEAIARVLIAYLVMDKLSALNMVVRNLGRVSSNHTLLLQIPSNVIIYKGTM